MKDQGFHLAWMPVVFAAFVVGRLMLYVKDRRWERWRSARRPTLVLMGLMFLAGLGFAMAMALRALLVSFVLWTAFLDCTSSLGGMNWWMGITTVSMCGFPSAMVGVFAIQYALEPWRLQCIAQLTQQAQHLQHLQQQQPLPQSPPPPLQPNPNDIAANDLATATAALL
jgi:hypothetical protein